MSISTRRTAAYQARDAVLNLRARIGVDDPASDELWAVALWLQALGSGTAAPTPAPTVTYQAPAPGEPISTPFPLRRDLLIKLVGLPADINIHDVERLVRFLRTLPCPGGDVEVCMVCKRGAADPGFYCPACGTKIPERRREATERLFPPGCGDGHTFAAALAELEPKKPGAA